jgi:lysophospholipase L1-like esterase
LVEANLAEMMRIVQLRKVAIIAGTVPLLNPEGFRTRGAANIPKLNEIIREEAEAKRVPIADHEEAFGKDFKGMGPDGLHPNALGYEIMAETWFDVIQTMVQP